MSRLLIIPSVCQAPVPLRAFALVIAPLPRSSHDLLPIWHQVSMQLADPPPQHHLIYVVYISFPLYPSVGFLFLR